MIKNILRSLLVKLGVVAAYPLESWKVYKDYVKIHPTAIIDPAASIKIFNPPVPPEICFEVGEGSHIFSRFSILRPQAKIKIGKNCQLGSSHFIAADSIEVGDDVLMAWGCTVMDNDSHPLKWEHRKNDVKQCYKDYLEDKSNFIKNKDWSMVKSGPIKIGDRSWIGFNASILKNVFIGEEAVVGGGAVVVVDVPSKTVVAGNPSKVIKKIDPVKNDV